MDVPTTEIAPPGTLLSGAPGTLLSGAPGTLLSGAPGTTRQGEIYIHGMLHQQREVIPTRQDALEAAAEAKMSPEAFAYVAGGAGREATAHANRTAFDRRRIVPRMLRDVGDRSMATTLLGRSRPHPLLVAPIGVQELAHPEGDLATARACAATNTPMIMSNQASYAMEDIAAAMGDAPRWFQLYWGKSDDLVASLVRRAEACGAGAIVVTLDTALLGWRTRDLDLGYLPFLQAKGIAQYTSDPVFRAMLGDKHDDAMAQATLFMGIYSNPTITWERLAFLRGVTKLPIILKGINHPADARQAIRSGMDGIIVSNHGGRQVDGAVAALDALELVAREVAGAMPVLFDSGIRSGADVFKAIALGADAVLIGRPYVYGLALAGEAGVSAVIRNMLAELDLTMGLSGCRTIGDIREATLVG
jgi:lactate 2-monooxygenase